MSEDKIPIFYYDAANYENDDYTTTTSLPKYQIKNSTTIGHGDLESPSTTHLSPSRVTTTESGHQMSPPSVDVSPSTPSTFVFSSTRATQNDENGTAVPVARENKDSSNWQGM